VQRSNKIPQTEDKLKLTSEKITAIQLPIFKLQSSQSSKNMKMMASDMIS